MINHHNYLLPYLIYRSAIYFYAYQGACRRQSMEPQRSSASERHSLGRKASSIVAQLNDATTPIDLALTNDQIRRSTLRLGRYAASSVASSTARSEEHTSELQSLMRISYAVFCLKKKTKPQLYKRQ